MYGNLFNEVIMLSPLISRMLLYIFLFSIIIVAFSDLFGKIHHISGKFYLLGWPQPLRFSLSSLDPFCSFVNTKVFLLVFI